MSQNEQDKLKEIQLDKVKLLERKLELAKGLPFLYGWKWYPWARQFFDSTHKISLLCAANQISKSSTQIRKAINWATDMNLWPALWNTKPNQFWYMYPSSKQIKTEFQTKWLQFLPTGKYKEEKILDGKLNPYHWKSSTYNKELESIYFPNTGVIIYFKSYNQAVNVLQSSTVYAIFADEEMPVELFDELMFRISASNGYFNMVFTATIGQDFWRQCMEPMDHERELLPHAHKQTVSMYDCQKYLDGTPSHWTDEKIEMVIQRCSSHNEILKRVWGRFIKDGETMKYHQFDLAKHLVKPEPIPPDWNIYAGVDIGSGGSTGHPAAIVFVAVSPDMKLGRVFLGWRGDGIPTTAGDVVEQFIKMKKENKVTTNLQFYDWASKDFYSISASMGEYFVMADKSHEKGEDLINSLFKNNMLLIHETPELRKLGYELSNLRNSGSKQSAADDLIDALRYAISKLPWDFHDLALNVGKSTAVKDEKPLSEEEYNLKRRRERFLDPPMEYGQEILDEFDEINALCGE